MKPFRYYMYDLKLRYKLLLSYLLLILIPMLLMFAFFQFRFVSRLEKNTLDMESVIVEQMSGNVEAYMSQVAGTADTVAQSEVLQKLLPYTATQMEQVMASQRQRDTLTTYLENIRSQIDGEVIQGIRIYCDGDHPLFDQDILTDYKIFESTEKIDTSLWYGLFQNQKEGEIVASAFYMNSWEGDTMGRISYVKRVQYYELGDKKEAYVAVYFNREYLTQVLTGYGNYPHSCIYIIDEKEGIVAMEGQDEMHQYILNYQDIGGLLEKEKTFRKIDYGDRNAWSIYHNIGRTGWKMVFTVSEDAIVKAARTDRLIFIGGYLIIAVILCVLVLLLSRSLTRRITVLKDEMQQVKNGPPKVLEVPRQSDEIGQLTESYNYMAGKINSLLAEKIRIVRENNRMEMNALRAQINPHFLYNTLDMISWYAKKGDTQEVTSSIQALARFYKLSLNQGKLVTTVKNEVQLLERYVELQCRRVRGDIELIVDIPEPMMEREIPQFLFQPIVENSLKHGILEKEEAAGYISVTGWMEEKEMVFVIADDGVGMEAEKASRLLEECRDSQGEMDGHIGVKNICRRLAMFYGEDGFSLGFTSRPGEGTQAELHLPYEIREEAFDNA
ncbi:MAG: histidine kinase [Eubacteriales bacterium]|nr:histidine kinase [Eubacteriales bacterium]